MTCPWLLKKDDSAWCTAVQPNVKLDFTKPSPPNVNGSICQLPEPNFETIPPWSVCERWKPENVEGTEDVVSSWVTHIDSRIIYASVLLIVVIGVVAQLSSTMIYSYLAVFLVVLIIIVNIFVIWSRVRSAMKPRKSSLENH